MSDRSRALAAVFIGVGSFALALCFRLVLHQQSSDFDQIVAGARRILDGQTPYTETPLPGLQWLIYCQMPPLVLGLPLVRMALPFANPFFVGFPARALDGQCRRMAMRSYSH